MAQVRVIALLIGCGCTSLLRRDRFYRLFLINLCNCEFFLFVFGLLGFCEGVDLLLLLLDVRLLRLQKLENFFGDRYLAGAVRVLRQLFDDLHVELVRVELVRRCRLVSVLVARLVECLISWCEVMSLRQRMHMRLASGHEIGGRCSLQVSLVNG